MIRLFLIIAEENNDSMQREIKNYLEDNNISPLLFLNSRTMFLIIETFMCEVFRKETNLNRDTEYCFVKVQNISHLL